MKATIYDGSATISKGLGRSEGERSFSVENLVAFTYRHYSSPDGRSGRSGVDLLGSTYLLQHEIVLEEYDNSTYPGKDSGPVGSMDQRIIEEIPDIWCHERCDWQQFGGSHQNFLCAVLDTAEEQIGTPFVKGKRIEEVRENHGKWLHVYEIDDTDYGIATRGKDFEEGVALVKEQSPKNKAAYGLAHWHEGAEVPVRFSKQDYYRPKAGIGGDGSATGGDWATTVRAGWLRVAPEVPDGSHSFVIFGYHASVWINRETKEIDLDLNVQSHWANSQRWWESPIEECYIQPGWFLLNGEDLYEKTVAEATKNREEKNRKKSEAFEAAKASALGAGLSETEVQQIIRASKGRICASLKAAAEMVTEGEKDVVNLFKGMKGCNIAVIQNYASLKRRASEISLKNVQRALERASSWHYLLQCVPGIGNGYFDDAMKALEIGSKTLNFQSTSSGTTILGQKLREAGLRPE